MEEHNNNPPLPEEPTTTSVADRTKQRNVYLHSIFFLLLFTAFQTSTGIAQRVLIGYQDETANSSHPFIGIDGYTSNAVLYVVFALFNWFAPVVIAVLNAKMAMVVGASTYAIYIAAYIYPNTVILYLCSALVGAGAAVLWTAQGAFISDNSTESTRQKNAGIFWAFLQASLICGNIYIYYAWRGVQEIHSPQRIPLYTIFTVLACLGSLGLLTVTNGSSESAEEDEDEELVGDDSDSELVEESTVQKCVRVVKEAVFLLPTGNMLIVLMGVNGITTGAGQVIGGLLFSMIPTIAERADKRVIVTLGCVVHVLAFIFIAGNFGAECADGRGLWFGESRYLVSVGIAFLLGFGDCCFNTQIYTHLGWYYKTNPAPAFAIFKSIQSVFAAGGFFFLANMSMLWQVAILGGLSVLSCATFVALCAKTAKERDE